MKITIYSIEDGRLLVGETRVIDSIKQGNPSYFWNYPERGRRARLVIKGNLLMNEQGRAAGRILHDSGLHAVAALGDADDIRCLKNRFNLTEVLT